VLSIVGKSPQSAGAKYSSRSLAEIEEGKNGSLPGLRKRKVKKLISYTCSHSTLITDPKTFLIRIISTISEGSAITPCFGKIVRHERAWSDKRAQLHER
jgi:hypothetical protein